jgi:hypothetical protein
LSQAIDERLIIATIMTDSVQAEHRRTISGNLDVEIDAIQCQRLVG